MHNVEEKKTQLNFKLLRNFAQYISGMCFLISNSLKYLAVFIPKYFITCKSKNIACNILHLLIKCHSTPVLAVFLFSNPVGSVDCTVAVFAHHAEFPGSHHLKYIMLC